jgi:HEAT repeat protein
MKLRTIAFTAGAVAALTSLGGASDPPLDVDVMVTSGSPLDWLNDIPRPTPTAERTNAAAADRRRQTMVEEAPHVQATDVFSFARITTVDLIGEIPWTVRKDQPTPAAYPPHVPDDVLWLALSVFLRKVLHPAQLSDAEAQEYLAYLGEPSLMAAEMARGDAELKDMIAHLKKAINPMPKERPEYDEGKTPEETMMLRLTYDDLVCAHPFSFDQKFAGRIALLGDEAIPYVIQASKSTHSFLHRNAAVMLGRYDDDRAKERLRELLTSSLDLSTRARVVDALVRRRDKKSVPLFHEMLQKTRDRSFAVSLIRGLGIIGDQTSVAVILEELARDPDDFDLAVASLTALARLGPKEQVPVRKMLDKIKNVKYAEVASSRGPSIPDPANCREQTIDHLVLMVRASMKEEGAPGELWRIFDDARRSAKEGPDDGRLARRGMTAQVYAPVGYAILEIAGRFEKGRAYLLEMAHDPREDVLMRVHSLIELARANPPDLKDRIADLAELGVDQPVAETAFRILGVIAVKEACEIASKWIDGYARDASLSRKFLVGLAVKYLSSKKAIKLDRLIEIVENEIIAIERGRAAKKQDPAAAPGGNQARMEFTSPVPFLEHVVAEIGTQRDASAGPILRDVLAAPGMPARAEAAVALGAVRWPDGWEALADALEDSDPWVRFMAYRGIKYSMGKDAPCDWLHGSPSDRLAAVKQYRAWIEEARKK